MEGREEPPVRTGLPVSESGPLQPLGGYHLVEKIAEGGMAEVFLARRHGDDARLFAVKRLHPALAEREQFVEMFASEGQVATLLRHPNIVRTYEAGRSPEGCFIAMEYLAGRELRELTRYLGERAERLPIPVALWIVEQILAGLAYAHQAADPQGKPLELVNRDVSPTNVMLTFGGQVKLIDFGIAQTTVGFTSQIGHIKGKIAYMSPEQVRGLPVDRRSDVFSAGIVLHELLSGRRLFTGESDFSMMEAVRLAPISPPSTHNPLVEPELDRIVLRALERQVSARWPGAAELGEALAGYRRQRGLAYGEQELSARMLSTFAEHHRADQERQERARGLVLVRSAPRAADTGEAAGQSAGTGHPPACATLRRLLPVLAGLLLGLLLSALVYWVVLGG